MDMNAVMDVAGPLCPFAGMFLGAFYCACKRSEQLDENYRILYPDHPDSKEEDA